MLARDHCIHDLRHSITWCKALSHWRALTADGIVLNLSLDDPDCSLLNPSHALSSRAQLACSQASKLDKLQRRQSRDCKRLTVANRHSNRGRSIKAAVGSATGRLYVRSPFSCMHACQIEECTRRSVAMAASFAPQRTADGAGCSYAVPPAGSKWAQPALGSQQMVTRNAGQRCRRRRRHLLMRSTTADLVSQTAVADVLSPLAELTPEGIIPTVSDFLRSAVRGLIGVSPQWLHPLEIMLGSDLVTVAELQPSTDSVLRLVVRCNMRHSSDAPFRRACIP